jgi:hypothetical protein
MKCACRFPFESSGPRGLQDARVERKSLVLSSLDSDPVRPNARTLALEGALVDHSSRVLDVDSPLNSCFHKDVPKRLAKRALFVQACMAGRSLEDPFGNRAAKVDRKGSHAFEVVHNGQVRAERSNLGRICKLLETK